MRSAARIACAGMHGQLTCVTGACNIPHKQKGTHNVVWPLAGPDYSTPSLKSRQNLAHGGVCQPSHAQRQKRKATSLVPDKAEMCDGCVCRASCPQAMSGSQHTVARMS